MLRLPGFMRARSPLALQIALHVISYLMRSSQPRMFFGLPGRVTMATTDSATTALLGTRVCKAQAPYTSVQY